MSKLELRLCASINEVDADTWNSLFGTDYPFTRHEFFRALETGGSTNAESGWQPSHATLYRGESLIAAMPMFLKTHSYGEYVFDWSWADAYHRHGREYYPKLLTAIPFTPATGPRLGAAPGEDRQQIASAFLAGVRQLSDEGGFSSWHVLFPEPELSAQLESVGLTVRQGSQFHWFNRGYQSFEEFLASFNSRKRKSLKRERRRVSEQGVKLSVIEGAELGPEDWSRFYNCYQLTYAKRSGHGGYLSHECFRALGQSMPEHIVMFAAHREEQFVGAALCFKSGDTLFGRYWGCLQELDCLHFEACYYQGIEYCIEKGLARFDPGAQGEHKIQRGFEPTPTRSCHWIADPAFAEAISEFTRSESDHVERYIDAASGYLPFKSSV